MDMTFNLLCSALKCPRALWSRGQKLGDSEKSKLQTEAEALKAKYEKQKVPAACCVSRPEAAVFSSHVFNALPLCVCVSPLCRLARPGEVWLGLAVHRLLARGSGGPV